MIHYAKGPHQFVGAWDISGESETADKLSEIINESVSVAKTLYKTEVYAIVSDNASNMKKMGRSVSLWHSTCSSHTANLLAKDVVDKDINKQIVSVLKEFKNVDLETFLLKEGGTKVVLPIDVRWCSYRNSYVSFIKNLPFMKRVSCDHSEKIKPAIQALLFDSEFCTKATELIELFDPICTLINQCQKSETSIADAVDLWLN